MMNISKYFISNNDYINIMKVNKKYHDLVKMYHFNPISDCLLFINMETQYLYHKNDNDQRLKKSNVYIRNNMTQLETWSGKKYSEVLYDSDIDGKSSVIDKINNHNFSMEQIQSIDYSLIKSKWEITIDVMMIIGKYFKTNNDYINVMKVNKKYHDLAKMYHFNPIRDYELFKKMETQHLYKPKDIKKEGMYQYVY